MFERFTEQARGVVVLAQEEARTLRHEYIGSEHMLLGILRSGGPACAALQSVGVGLAEARNETVELVAPGEGSRSGQIPFTPRAKHVLERSLKEALARGDDHIGEEHLLAGLLRQTEGVAIEVLERLGVDREELARRGYDAAMHGIETGQPSLRIDPPPRMSRAGSEVLNRAVEIARERGAEELEPSDFRQALDEGGETGP